MVGKYKLGVVVVRLWADVPERWKPLIHRAKEMEGWNSLSAYIRELIKKDLASKGLLGVKNREKEAVLEEG